ncbi:MAG: hypothetical protein OES09_00530 [Gammaproteobacteria bacterium]|nr:hypothetical protein [Gammaproteobacteria bacterium]
MTMGISDFRDEQRCVSLLGMLTSPLVGRAGEYPANRGLRTSGEINMCEKFESGRVGFDIGAQDW